MTVSNRRVRSTGKRAIGVLAAGAIVVPMSPFVSSAVAATPTVRGTATACSPGQVQSAGYTDISNSQFQLEINCISAYGVATGKTATMYAPLDAVSRQQMAQFIYRLALKAGVNLSNTADAGFTDIGSASTEAKNAINALKNAGIISGKTATTFGPLENVSGQMATFINNAQGAITVKFTSTEDYYTDDNTSVHQANINAISAAGIATGTSASTYMPLSDVTRAQMAGFVGRLTDFNVANGKIKSAYAAPKPFDLVTDVRHQASACIAISSCFLIIHK